MSSVADKKPQKKRYVDNGWPASEDGDHAVSELAADRTGAVVDLLRSNGIAGPGPDRHLSPEIEAAVDLVQSGAVLAAAESVVGQLA